MAKLVSNVYGEALFELAMEQDRLDAYLEESQGVLDVLRDNQEFSQMMTHPNIIKEEKLQMVETVFKGRISDEMVGLMRMIVEKDHFAKMPEVLTFFIDKALEEKKVGIAYVTHTGGSYRCPEKADRGPFARDHCIPVISYALCGGCRPDRRDGNPYWGSRCGQQCAHQDLRTIERIIQNTVESR